MNIKEVEAIYPLSPLQEAILSDSVQSQGLKAKVSQWECTLQGYLDVSAFEKAWQEVIDRHSVLRTFFVWKRVEKPLQVARKRLEFTPAKQDWSRLPAAEQRERFEAFLRADRDQPFNPSEAPLMRVTLCQMSDDAHELVVSYDRLVLDERSLHLILEEVFAYYEAFSQGQELQLPLGRPYGSYAAWLKNQDRSRSEAFWRKELAGVTTPTPLVDRVPANSSGEEGAYGERQLQMSASDTAALEALARENGLDPRTLVVGAWAALLGRYSDQEDVVFGVTVSGRPRDLQGSELMVGPYMNTLPVRGRMFLDKPVLSCLKEFEAWQAALHDFAYESPSQIRAWGDADDGLPLFESRVVFDNHPAESLMSRQYAGISVSDVRDSGQMNLPVTVEARFNPDLALRIVYDRSRFDGGTVGRMLEQVETLLQGMAAQPEQPVLTLPLLSESSLRQMLVEWNDTKTDAPHDKCIHQLFEEQAERTPDTLAVVFEDERLTYRELNSRANQLARYLRKQGVTPGVLVALCVERRAEMVVGIVGVLKAGAAYVPIDPSYPFERISSMLDDAQPPVLLTQELLIEELPSFQGRAVFLDADWELIAKESEENFDGGAKAEDLAYVIYTSGSTGKPKGVMVPHKGVCNSSDVYARVINLPPGSRMLQIASLAFDMSVFDIVPALISGLTLCLADQDPPLGAELLAVLQQQEIDVISFPPSMLATLPVVELPKLKFIGVAGEAVSADLVARWAPGRRFYNAFGPAEGSVWVSGAYLDGSSNPIIGRPIDNIQLYLLDSSWRPVPIGVPGELCIGGIGVTWGYLRQPSVTAEKYIPNPFSDTPGARLYRTGDSAHYLPDGNLEFLGRIDHQVKIRGFRVELGEVEAVLGRHPAVREAVVVAREDTPGDKRLVAYILSHQDQAPRVSELHAYMKKKLPDNMVPSAFVLMDALPLSPNGKVDRRALPAPDLTRPELEEPFVAPRSHVEEVLAKIWADVLRVEQVGIHDNFFELGGHSLLATQVVSRVRDTFQVELSLPRFFESPRVATLSKVIEEAQLDKTATHQPNIVPVSRETHRIKRSALEAGK
jgi:amino acid adenylation domain-containing protein